MIEKIDLPNIKIGAMIGEKSVDKIIADKLDELVEEVNRLTTNKSTCTDPNCHCWKH